MYVFVIQILLSYHLDMKRRKAGRPSIKKQDKLIIRSIRLHPGVIKKLEERAKVEKRTFSALVALLLEDALGG